MTPHSSLALVWQVGHAASEDAAPAAWIAAQVPGAVQLDWAKAHGWPPHWQGDQIGTYRWMEDAWWTYRTTLPELPVTPGNRLVLVCRGIDARARVALNGVLLAEHEGLYVPLEIDLTDRAQTGDTLTIQIAPAPKAPGCAEGRTQARLTTKPAVAYGWDFHPRLIPLGLWDDVTLELRPVAHWRTFEVTTTLAPDLTRAELLVHVDATAAAHDLRWTWSLRDPDDGVVLQGEGVARAGAATTRMTLEAPQLWWPHDHGAQPLYHFSAQLWRSDGTPAEERRVRLGFRRTRLIMHPGAWDGPAGFPKTRSAPPITLEINNRPIFVRGSNWVPPDIFPGRVDATTLRPLLELARSAHLNLLRSWGGGFVNKPAFFDLCDELGLLVWQEFPLACNDYPDDPAYLALLERESRAIIRRVRSHPCLALWSGGNELFNAWSGMTDQAAALRLLNRATFELDPGTPFIPTAPLEGMGHGDYRFRDERGREVFQIYRESACTAYSEFGCPGPASVEVLREIIPAPELWPIQPGTSWETHHALGAWEMQPDTWGCLSTIEHYFGPTPDLETFVARGQWLQAEGLKAIFEETRRQKPRNAMSLNWCFNEPWPAAANSSVVSWPARPKPGYHAMAAACRPTLVSARIPRFQWIEGEIFTAEVWLLHDGYTDVPGDLVTARLVAGTHEQEVLVWPHAALTPNTHLSGPVLRVSLPVGTGETQFTLQLLSRSHPQWNSFYTLPLASRIPAS